MGKSLGPQPEEPPRAFEHCVICGHEASFRFDPTKISAQLKQVWGISDRLAEAFNRRESMFCSSCGSSLRVRRLCTALIQTFSEMSGRHYDSFTHLLEDDGFRRLRIAEINACGALHRYLKQHPNLCYSEYVPGVPRGSEYNGIRCEDLQELTYPSDYFDIILTSDTLEHVPDPDKAWSEIRRTLKPSGYHIFTIPVVPAQPGTRQRARRSGGPIEYLTEPAYHAREWGAEDLLVYTDFAMDVVDALNKLGLSTEVLYYDQGDTDVAFVFRSLKHPMTDATKTEPARLDWTGERFLPWMEGAQPHYEHLHRYVFAAHLVKGKKVLDLACGEGYGTYMLAREAEYVAGVEIDKLTVQHARSRYVKDNLEFIEGSILAVPIEGENKFDIAVCFEAIEHVAEHDKLLSEVKRLLKDDGLFIVSTPNKAVYTDARHHHSHFHVKELYFDEFRILLRRYFAHTHIFGQRTYAGSNMWSIHQRKSRGYMEEVVNKGDTEFYLAERTSKEPFFFIALASNASLKPWISITDSWLTDASNELFNAYERRLAKLNHTLQDKAARISSLEASLQEKVAHTASLEARVTELSLREREADKLRQRVTTLEARLAAVHSSYSWRITAPLRAVYGRVRWFLRNARRMLKLLGWLGTGQFTRAGQALLPYYRRYVPLRVKKMLPHRMRIALKQRLIGQARSLPAKPAPSLRTAIAKAEAAFAAEDWPEAAKCWEAVLAAVRDNHVLSGQAKLNISVARRLCSLRGYKKQIAEYVAARATSNRQPKDHRRIVIYTAISGGYDTLKLPEKVDPRFDYVLFTDEPAPDTGVWQVRTTTYFHADKTRTARFAKTHPHMLLDSYDIAIWIDANIMILGDIYPLVERFLTSGKAVAGVAHPFRTSVYEELEACTRNNSDDCGTMREQLARYRSMDFDHDDLIESSLMMFNLRDDRIKAFLDTWWAEIDRYSKRDQLSLNYALAQNSLEWHPLTEPANNIRNHPAFARVRHDADDGPARKLIDALEVPVIRPYAGPSYAEVRDSRIAAQKHRRIDIVVCVHNALEEVKLCLGSIRRAHSSDRQRLIIIDDGSDSGTPQYLKSFASNHPWIDLHRNEHAQGYPKAANQGLAASSGELVILLNSDTIVTDGWAEKMADAVFSTPGAGVVGPMSNAASHQSIPEHLGTKNQTAINELPPGLTAEDMNRYCERWTTVDVLPRVPLVHGFCLGLTREVLDRVGFFDADNFPRGYGEENDYCFRATDAGFSLVIATHTYIFHAKSKSYVGPDRVALMKTSSEVLARLYGPARIKRAVTSMQDNPLLRNLRQRAQSLTQPTSSPSACLSQQSGKSRPQNRATPAPPYNSQLGKNAQFLIYDVSSEILRKNWEVIDRFREDPHLELNRALWLLPSFNHIYRGGIYTIFRVADSFSRRFGTVNTVALHGGTDLTLPDLETMIRRAFPSLKFQLTVVPDLRGADDLPPSDAAFCTLWTTAYILVRYNKCKGKFYFVQDFEPAFYAAGSTYGLIEQTYRFGFNGVANTPGVGELYRQYNPWVQYFIPGVDKSIFFPEPERSAHNRIWRIVFYGRPRNNRNAFELGIRALSLVKDELGDAVEILSVGSDFSESDYGITRILTNRGVLQSLEDVAALYRSSDVGLVFMYTAHPSYQPFEFMASGCATVSNFNRYTQWFLRDGENAALAHSTPTCIAERILAVLQGEELRRGIVEGGLRTVSTLEWDAALERILKFVCHPSPRRSQFLSRDMHLYGTTR